MKIEDQFVYFDDKTSVSSILKQYASLEEESREFNHLERYNHLSSSIYLIKNALQKTSYLDADEKKSLIKLLNKENLGHQENEGSLFRRKFFFLFATLDYINRKELGHSLKTIHDNGDVEFSGALSKVLNGIDYAFSTNPLDQVDEIKDTDQITEEIQEDLNFSKNWKTVSQKSRKHFFSDMNEAEYDGLLNEYEDHKKKIEKIDVKIKISKMKP